MTNSRLDALREHYKQQEEQKASRERKNSGYYPFYKIPFGTDAIVRFIPDANPTNILGFMVESSTHALHINGIDKKVPCMKIYGKKRCPICDLSQDFYKRKDDQNGKQLYRELKYTMRALIVKDPLPVPDGGESNVNKIKTLTITKQVAQRILSALNNTTDPLPSMPDDLKTGFNFVISRQKNGDGHADYTQSSFARSSTAVPDGLVTDEDIVDLRNLLPKEPTDEQIDAMLRAHLTGEPYDDGSSAFRRAKTGVQSLDKYIKTTSPSPKTVISRDDDGDDTVVGSAIDNTAVNSVSDTSDDEDALMQEIIKRAATRRANKQV